MASHFHNFFKCLVSELIELFLDCLELFHYFF